MIIVQNSLKTNTNCYRPTEPITINSSRKYQPFSTLLITTYPRYGTALNLNKDGDETESGYIKCVSDSPGPTSYRPSFLNTYYGRSHTGSGVYKVDSAMRRYAVQSYNGT